MKALDDYFKLQAEIFEYFDYVEDWRVIPIQDNRGFYWQLDGEGPGVVRYADKAETLNPEAIEAGADYYEDSIYTQRFLPKWVYRGDDYTMVCSDPHVDCNQFLRIFENSKEIK